MLQPKALPVQSDKHNNRTVGPTQEELLDIVWLEGRQLPPIDQVGRREIEIQSRRVQDQSLPLVCGPF
jgi:hypothetical protein